MTERTVKLEEALRWAKAHWTASDGPLADSAWKTVPSASSLGPSPVDVTYADIDADEARRLHSPGSAPVVLRGAAVNWKATNTWTLEWFAANYGDHEVPTDDCNPDGSTVVRDLRDCIELTRQGAGGYARFSPLLITNPELTTHLDPVQMAEMCGAPIRQLLFQLFLGGAGTRTETHCAIGNNVFVQAYGEKIWRFVAPQFGGALEPMPTGRPYFASRATLHDESLDSHPDAPVHLVHLREGDVLLVPPFWWHQVDNPTESIGVAGRWHNLGHAFSQSAFMSLMTMTATNPNVIRANKDRKRFGYVYQETIDQASQPLANAA